MRVPIPLIFLFLLSGSVFAQNSETRPYTGLSTNFFGISNTGWGIEIGLTYYNLYIGAEYGNYGSEYNPYNIYNGEILQGIDRIPPPPIVTNYAATREHFFSTYGGIVLKKTFWFGILAVISEQTNLQFVTQSYKWSNVQNYWFGIGFDFRIEGWSHWLLDLSYSHRRGMKSGFGYIF